MRATDKRRRNHIAIVAAPALLLFGASCLLLSCARQRNPLEPAPTASIVGEDTMIQSQEGVEVKTEVDAWNGDPDILQHVTPVRVTLTNNSGKPLRVQYRQFELRADEDTTFPALPLYRIQGTETDVVAVVGYDPPMTDFLHDRFAVDPIYARAYPGITPYAAALDRDLGYYDRYYVYWRNPLPTRQMIARALPEGVVEPGGKVSGFLYFQRLDEDLGLVRFQARLVNARDGARFGNVEIPMLTTEPRG